LTAEAPAQAPTRPHAGRPADVAVAVGFLLTSLTLYGGLWADLRRNYLVHSGQDQTLFEWFFAVHADALAHGRLTLFTTLQNHPDGINLMANTSMPGLSVPLAPLTWLGGPTLTWAVVLTVGLAAAAFGWYLLFQRCLVTSRWAAVVGGAWCALAPPVISHAFAHPNFAATFLLPAIVYRVLRLTRPGVPRRPVRDGALLGALGAWQVLIGEEPLLILATGLLVFGLAWAVARPADARAALRPLAAGLGVAVAVALALVGYPLWVQFAGPGSYHALQHGPAGNDLATLAALPRQSLGGELLHPGAEVPKPTEQNAYFGWGLIALVVVTAVWLRHDLRARLAAVTALVGLLLSLGDPLFLDSRNTGVPGPWALFARLPLFESVIEARMTFLAVPAVGMLLALGTERARPVRVRTAWLVGLAAALVPIVPVPFAAEPRPDTPELFAAGGWRDLVHPGRSVVSAPPPDAGDALPLRWQVVAGLGFPIAEGYFVGPNGPDRGGMYGTNRRATSRLLADAARTGVVPPIGPAERAEAVADLRAWQADLVVLAPRPNDAAVRATLDALLGPGQDRGGVTAWDVRALTG
jgi:hypothetical protein